MSQLPSKKKNTEHWSSIHEAGTLTGMRFLFLLYRIFGRWIFTAAMFPVSLYFLLFRSEQRKASVEYLSNLYKVSPTTFKRRTHAGHSFLHFKAFSDVILDKLLAWTIPIQESEFHLTQPNVVERLMQDSRGQLIIGSHFGNLEYCRGFMQRYKDKTINILVYDKHAANFVRMMEKQNPLSRVNVFQVDDFDIATMLTLQQKIANGEWVFIAGDRVPLSGAQHTVGVTFLGKSAPFPSGPYLLAKALGCPVKFMFAYRHKPLNNKIVFDVVDVTEKLELSRATRQQDIQKYAQKLATSLELHCKKAPYQWFNFYPYWERAGTRNHTDIARAHP